jgi:UDP-glucose:(heptosyl)LPS alpha-1,3-glucosyltransferase
MRWWDTHFRRLRYDLVYTPGINCLNADVSAVHIVFGEFRRLAETELRFRNNPLVCWPRLLHRRLYYRLIAALESVVYSKRSLAITVVSRQVAEEIGRHYRRETDVHLLYNAVACSTFNMQERLKRRSESRRHLGLDDAEVALLLIGNDWKKKGLPRVIEAIPLLRGLRLKLMVAGRDDPIPFRTLAERLKVSDCLLFLEPSSDVMQFYAAADVYVAPSLHDSFAFPPLEAMASGLPVITSAQNGGSEIITHDLDGFVLKDPANVEGLAELIRKLYLDPALRARVGGNAAETVTQYTWDRNTEQLHSLFQEVIKRKQHVVPCMSPAAQGRKR